MRLRRATTIVSYWEKHKLVFENYLTRRCITADPLTTVLLHAFEEWRSLPQLLRGMPQARGRELQRAARQLVQHTFLLRQGSPEARRDARFAGAWKPWLPHAGFFHFGTRDVSYWSEEPVVQRTLRRFLAEKPQPPLFKTYRSAPRIPLERPTLPDSPPPRGSGAAGAPDELFRMLLARRTHRKFSHQALGLSELSQLLYYPWGVTGLARVPVLGTVLLKTSPSGGARHPGEVYVLPLRVDGLPTGLYHYHSRQHALERIRGLDRAASRAVAYCGGQAWVGKAAAIFLMTAVFQRNMWKYRMARGYRVLLTEAGHLCQVFCLVATALGLAPFCTMALADSAIESDLGLNGSDETILYVAGVGFPAKGGAGPAGPITSPA